ncbi:hypothetical protein [Stieleria varia]|nr:hypothetical protein [Stieleria varia]
MSEETTAADRWLIRFLQMVGVFTLFAFPAAVMPESWMIRIAQWLTIKPFPSAPLTFYLARNLSLIYGFGGIGLFVIANDLPRYRPMIRWLAIGTIGFGVMQGVVDGMSSLPIWWTLGESLSTIMGGCLIAWLGRRSAASHQERHVGV